ncbi:hypothetical protein CK203_060996 [Vitis vinifera]|uniref:Retrotransposon gag domain-containing protein n=1 Tax=Vitis vinifera TaxID=29760 RepID=A0A438G6K9_VITVI|nr:hypothetical protein CK203_060996 [Vitis vinifera]
MYELCFVFINCALIPFLDSALLFAAQGLATGYIDAREHSGGERHFDVDWSPIIEDLYSPELGNPLGCRGSACVEVMTTLHGSTPSLFEACRGLRIAGGSTDTFSLGTTSWIRVGGRLIRVSDQLDQRSDQRDMDSQIVTVDQFAEAMASIQEAIASLVPPPPPPSQSAPQAVPFTLHSQTRVALPPITVPTPTLEDPHARMDRLEQDLRQLRASDRATTWEGFDGVPVASLPAKFRMLDIERYTGIGCPRLHLRLYSTMMRAHGLDEPQMITLFPLSLSGAAQRWFASLEASRRRTWDDLAHEFLRQFSFNTVVDVSRRELEALREGPDSDGFEEPAAADRQTCGRGPVHRFWVSGYGSVRCRGRHLERIMDRLFPSDIKGKKPFIGSRPADYRPWAPRPTYDQTYTPQTLALPYYASQGIERPSVSYTPTGQPCYAAQFTARPAASYPRPRAQQTSAPFALRAQRQFSQIGMPLSQALRKLTEVGLLTTLTPRPPPQPIPPQFRMDLHCAYHQGPRHETDRCTALRHAVQGFDRPGFGTLGSAECDHEPVACSHHTCSPSTSR